MVDGFRTMSALAESAHHVVPGHDPLVMTRYPAPEKAMAGIIVRLDVDPAH
jgi:hypothetical protein